MKKSDTLEQYEQNQEFNSLTSWLHSHRYKNILAVFDELAESIADRPIRIVEIGCGYAKLFSILNERYLIEYTGIDLAEDRIRVANERYDSLANFSAIEDSADVRLKGIADADIVVALETLEHIPEHIVVRIVEEVARIRPRVFVCSVPVEVGPIIWVKNLGSRLMGYRRTNYTWMETFWAGLYRLDKLPPHDTSHKGFDWRWLAQTIRHNMNIQEMRKFPFGFLPAALSTNVFFVVNPR